MLLTEDPPLDLPTPTGPMRTYMYRPVPALATTAASERVGRNPSAAAPTDLASPRGNPGGTSDRYPGIVLFSEIYQRTGPIHRMARLIAGLGFVVAVPEIFHELEAAGSVLGYDQAGTDRGNACKVGKLVAAYDADARAALDALAASAHCSGKLGALGVCIGGHLAFRAAMHAGVRATACFYATDIHNGSLGQGGDDSLARLGDIAGELLLVWGRQDPHIPDDGRAKIRGALEAAKRVFTWHEVNAQHAFLRDEGPRYDPALALWAYAATESLFRRALA